MFASATIGFRALTSNTDLDELRQYVLAVVQKDRNPKQ